MVNASLAIEIEKRLDAANQNYVDAQIEANRAWVAYQELQLRNAEPSSIQSAWNLHVSAQLHLRSAGEQIAIVEQQKYYAKITIQEQIAKELVNAQKAKYPSVMGTLTDVGLRSMLDHVWIDDRAGVQILCGNFEVRVASDDPTAIQALRTHLMVIGRNASAVRSVLDQIPATPQARITTATPTMERNTGTPYSG